MAKVKREEVIWTMVSVEHGKSVRGCARELGVSESTLRYRLARGRSGAEDGRKAQPSSCDGYAALIQQWIEQQQGEAGGGPAEAVKRLYALLLGQGYQGSYRSVLRYVQRHRPLPVFRPLRRVETRPGAQAQVDWVSRKPIVEELGGQTTLHAFVMTLSHSRMFAVVWSVRQDLFSWITCHNRAWVFLGGVTATVRIDNLKTGVASGGGAWAVLNSDYASYADQLGFVVDPCRVRQASDKGKVERRGRDLVWLGVQDGEGFATLADLQRTTEQRVLERSKQLICPATGLSVFESWQREIGCLRSLPPSLPEPFDVQVTRTVGEDCLVSFEGRQYSVPFRFVRQAVQVRGCGQQVKIYSQGACLASFPRATACRLLIDQSHYEGEGTPQVVRPTPLGEVGKSIVLPRSWEAPARAIERYEQLVRSLS